MGEKLSVWERGRSRERKRRKGYRKRAERVGERRERERGRKRRGEGEILMKFLYVQMKRHSGVEQKGES
jgi:hypothetical protein